MGNINFGINILDYPIYEGQSKGFVDNNNKRNLLQQYMQSFMRLNQLLKQIYHFSSGRVQSASSGLSNQIPSIFSLIVGNKKKSHRAKSGL